MSLLHSQRPAVERLIRIYYKQYKRGCDKIR